MPNPKLELAQVILREAVTNPTTRIICSELLTVLMGENIRIGFLPLEGGEITVFGNPGDAASGEYGWERQIGTQPKRLMPDSVHFVEGVEQVLVETYDGQARLEFDEADRPNFELVEV